MLIFTKHQKTGKLESSKTIVADLSPRKNSIITLDENMNNYKDFQIPNNKIAKTLQPFKSKYIEWSIKL